MEEIETRSINDQRNQIDIFSSKYLSFIKNLKKEDYFEYEKSKKFEFEDVISYLKEQTTLFHLEPMKYHLDDFEKFYKNYNDLFISKRKAQYIVEKHSKFDNEKMMIKEIYEFYIQSFFDFTKSKQIMTLNITSESHSTTKNYFIKVLNLDDSLNGILDLIKEYEKTLGDELLELIESIHFI